MTIVQSEATIEGSYSAGVGGPMDEVEPVNCIRVRNVRGLS